MTRKKEKDPPFEEALRGVLKNIVERLDSMEQKIAQISEQKTPEATIERKQGKVGRPSLNPDGGPTERRVNIRFPHHLEQKMREAIEAEGDDETHSDFIRGAVFNEIKKRFDEMKKKDKK